MTDETQETKSLLTQAEKDQAVKAARTNDLRRLIAILFVIYGVIVTIVGIVAPNMNGADTNGIAINLWTGIIMLVIGSSSRCGAASSRCRPTTSSPPPRSRRVRRRLSTKATRSDSRLTFVGRNGSVIGRGS